jgi:TetR/AcrR family transcriptional regulator
VTSKPTTFPARMRNADRSREAILAAAERLFAERGYEAASLSDIGAAAGLSRGAPRYFFGSKEHLYVEVLRRALAVRRWATQAAFRPVLDWCRGAGDLGLLRVALASAVDEYLTFLSTHPTFTALLMREELDQAGCLLSLGGAPTGMQAAFRALRAAGRERGLRAFDVDDAVLLCTMLTFGAFSSGSTLMRTIARDLGRADDRAEHVELAVDQLMYLLCG